MFAESLDQNTGLFTVRTHWHQTLRAPDYVHPDGQIEMRKWLPCTHCLKLHDVALAVVSLFCDECRDDQDPDNRGEISGYSHACGYHD